MKILLLTFFAMLAFSQCWQQGSQKELELKEKELSLKEKEMEMNKNGKDDKNAEVKSEKKESTDDDDKKETKKTSESNENPNTSGMTAVKFDAGKTSKTLNVTINSQETKQFSLDVGSGQVINVTVPENVQMAVTLNLINGKSGDNWEDGFGYLSILAGRKGVYMIEVKNQSEEPLTIPMKFSVTNNKDDYEGGIQ